MSDKVVAPEEEEPNLKLPLPTENSPDEELFSWMDAHHVEEVEEQGFQSSPDFSLGSPVFEARSPEIKDASFDPFEEDIPWFDDAELEDESKLPIKPSPKKFEGFATGNGKQIVVSKEALDKAKEIWKASDTEDLKSAAATPKFKGFATAAGNSINVSNDALEKTRSMWKDIEAEAKQQVQDKESSNLNRSAFVNSSTSNGEKCKEPEEALDRTSDISHKEDMETLVPDNERKLAVNKSYGPTTVSKEDMELASKYLDCDKPIGQFKGFVTAKGKSISVSESAMQKAKALFDKAIHEEPIPSTTKPIAISKEALGKVSTFWKEGASPKNASQIGKSTPALGFCTGNGKAVAVPSGEAFQKARRLLDDVNESGQPPKKIKLDFQSPAATAAPRIMTPKNTPIVQKGRRSVGLSRLSKAQPLPSVSTDLSTGSSPLFRAGLKPLPFKAPLRTSKPQDLDKMMSKESQEFEQEIANWMDQNETKI
jgi:hypothetical protein